MFQRTVNKIFNERLIPVIESTTKTYGLRKRKLDKGKFACYDRPKNIYTDYLLNLKKSTDYNTFLKAISYCTKDHTNLWDHPKSGYLFTHREVNKKLEPTLSTQLCEKLISCVPDKIFSDKIVNYLLDYHVMFDKDGNTIPINQYPSIYFAVGYFAEFGTIYCEKDFTNKEIEEMSAMAHSHNIIINTKNELKIVKLRGEKHKPKKNKSKIYTFDKTKNSLIDFLLTLAIGSEVKLNKTLNKLHSDDKIYTKLLNILKVK